MLLVTGCRKSEWVSVQEYACREGEVTCMCEHAGVQELGIEDVIQLVGHRVQHDASTAFSLMQQGIFSPESTLSADSLIVFVQPARATACINIGVHVTNPKH